MHSFLQGWNPRLSPFWVPPPPSPPTLLLFLKQIKKVTPSFWEPSKLVLQIVWNTLKRKCYASYYTKSIESIIIITLYTFKLNSVFTTDICFDIGYILLDIG